VTGPLLASDLESTASKSAKMSDQRSVVRANPSNHGSIMARKTVSIREKRAEAEAAAKKGKSATAKKAAAPKKEPAKRKSRAKSAKEVRLKAFWGVFNQSLKRVALFEHQDKKLADKKAKELTASGKSPHFVQPVKEAVQE
jgi:hypothetical protein